MAECFNGEGRISFRGIPSPYEYTQSCSIQDRSFEKLVKDNPLYSEKEIQASDHTYKVWVFKRVVS
jgi:hypothetical protein